MVRVPLRLPAHLKEGLDQKKASLPGTSMNDLIVLGVQNVVEGTDLTLVTKSEDVVDAQEDLVVAAIEGGIGATKGIAKHYVALGQPNLGALLYWVAAEMQPDSKEAAKELIRTASVVRRRSRPIEKALLRAALVHNSANGVAKNRLGQILYFEGDYAGAAELLKPVSDDDNYAKLFYGWSTLELATIAGSQAGLNRALSEIVAALRRWALGQSRPDSREKWLTQVAKLKGRGQEFDQAVESLIAYANDNTSWKPIVVSEVASPTQTTTTEAEFEELSGEGSQP